MIPTEAVEAVIRELLELHTEELFRGHLSNGCKTCEGGEWPCETVTLVRRIEAAAPHVGPRSVWHDAVAEAYVEGALSAEQANVMWAKNPYRRTDAV